MKIQATKKAFYNGRIIKVGEVIDLKEDELPSWATLANGKIKKPKEDKQPEENKDENKDEKINENSGDDESKQPKEDIDANNPQKIAELDALLTEGIEYNVSIDTANKTIEEQIVEIKGLIEQAKANKE